MILTSFHSVWLRALAAFAIALALLPAAPPAHAVSASAADVACPAPPTELISIPALQGTGDTNTANGQARTVRGVVVADTQGSAGQNGFYIQDPAGDGDLLTSDGIFVFVPSANSAWFGFDVAVGEALQVSGTAKEFNGMTELDTVTSIVKCGADATVAPTPVSLPEQTNGELEHLEGMLVSITQTLTLQQNFFLGRYGQVTLGVGRLFQPTNQFRPGTPEAAALADLNARSMIVLDDGSSRQNVNPTPYIGADNTLRAGDTTSNLVGVLDYGAINSNSAIRDYRLQPTQPVSFVRANPRQPAPERVGGNVKVASANVLNYFTTLDTGSPNCYSSTGPTDCRGANTVAEFTRQRTKIISELLTLNADVFGLMEVENNGPTAVGDLVSGLNVISGTNTYTVAIEPTNDPISDTKRLGGDAIKVAMIYKPAVVTPRGVALSSPDTVFSRAPFAQTFTLNANGAVFSVIVNHFKSKGSCPTSAGDPNADKGDGQGCWNALRVQQAQALLTLIATVKQSSGSDDVLVIGDLNSYGQEDPIAALTGGGLVNELSKRIATPYSFVFDGLAGYLDHALATASLDAKVSGVAEWHNNADEPSIIDYNTEFKVNPDCPNGASCTSPDLYAPVPFRASDHDPVLIGLNLGVGAGKSLVYLPLVAKGP